ncbi:MAG: RNA-binding protein [Flavobacteriaceae bacterium]|nr:RNA-binding protein [Flavobacteriaceae bacterium]
MAKRFGDQTTLGDVLKDFIESNRLQTGLDKISVKEAWHEVMGDAISNYTTGLKLERDVLYVQLSSSVLREELSYGKEKIITMLNQELGKELINSIILR